MSASVIAVLLSALGWLKRAVEALAAVAVRHPWPALCALLALVCVLLWRGERKAQQRYAEASRTVAAMRDAAKQAAAISVAQRQADEHHYKELAHDADLQYAAQAADARAATAAFIRTHRLQPFGARPAGDTAGETQGGGSGIPADAAAQAELVAVTASDVNVCAADYSYAKAAYDWAHTLGQ